MCRGRFLVSNALSVDVLYTMFVETAICNNMLYDICFLPTTRLLEIEPLPPWPVFEGPCVDVYPPTRQTRCSLLATSRRNVTSRPTSIDREKSYTTRHPPMGTRSDETGFVVGRSWARAALLIERGGLDSLCCRPLARRVGGQEGLDMAVSR